jgi:hypothetical protein
VCEPRGCRRWRAEEYGRWIPPVTGTCSTFDETSQECVVDYLTVAGGFLLGRNQRKLRRTGGMPLYVYALVDQLSPSPLDVRERSAADF